MTDQRPIATTNLPARVPLGAKPLGIWGSFLAGQRNVLELIPEAATRLPVLSGTTGKRWLMLMDPDGLRHVLRDAVDDYPKSTVTKLILGPAIGNSMFVAEGAEWKWQRRTAAPVFGHRNIAALAPVMTAAAESASARFAAAAGSSPNRGRAIDAFDEMVTATFEVISDVTLSGGEGFDRTAVHAAIEEYIGSSAKLSVLDIIGAPPWVPRPGRLFAAATMRQMKQTADRAILDRKTRGANPIPDLLDLLIAGEDPASGRRMTVDELRDNLLTFIVAGHETTALTLAWSLYLCAFDPKIQSAARAEAQAALGPRAATTADLANLPLIRRIVDEALRLYPPAAFLARTAQKPDTLCGHPVRRHDTIILPIYALHRHHALWQNPDAFDPDRFLTPPTRFSYLPFGDGPRICIGASFALQEAVIILATLLARFRYALIPGRTPKPAMILTLRPQGGVWLAVERVENSQLKD